MLIPARSRRRSRRALGRSRRHSPLLAGRRVVPRNRVLAALGEADQAVLRLLRTRGHSEPIETVVKALGLAGEYGAVWAVIGAIGGLIDERRRGAWLRAGATGPAAVAINFAVKRAVGRQRPLIEDHPPLARAPTRLSFPSAHATSSVAAATALRRVERRAGLPLFALAAAICAGRPYLGMHYPSDVLAGAALGFAIGALVPGVDGDRPAPEERLLDLGFDAHHAGRRNGEPDRASATRAVVASEDPEAGGAGRAEA